MDWKTEWKPLSLFLAAFGVLFFLPVGMPRFDGALLEAFHLVKWYAQEHVLLCLIPAFFIAGAIAVFVRQTAVMKYLGAGAKKPLAYSVGAVSGTVLAVCSCTVLPLFAGIYRMGAGLGPATAFLYSGPAINALAIILTARVLGLELGMARAVGAVSFSILIGLVMHLIYRQEEREKARLQAAVAAPEDGRPLWQTALYFAAMLGVLIFANWGKPQEGGGLWAGLYAAKWLLTGLSAAGLGLILAVWFFVPWYQLVLLAVAVTAGAVLFPGIPLIPFSVATVGLSILTARRDDEVGEWFQQSWGFAKQIVPLLLGGVLVAGLLLGRPDHEGLIPSAWVARALGGNSWTANAFAAIAGAFMYFATLTEIPILQGLIGAGMGKGPALALLLAGPALSLPNMLVIRSVIGTQKTVIYVCLVVVMSTTSGILFGTFF